MTPMEAVAVLVSAFRQDRIEDDTVGLYTRKLIDIAPALLDAAVNRIVDRSKFFPTIAEIRETAANIAGVLPLSPEEAMAIVREADVEEPMCTRDGEYRYTERYWRWPERASPQMIGHIRAVLAHIGDPVSGRDGKRIFGWEVDFKRIYAQTIDQARCNVLADLSHARLPARRQMAALAPAADGKTEG